MIDEVKNGCKDYVYDSGRARGSLHGFQWMEKQLTYTSWNNRGEKFDLRSWNEEHTAMTKGLTLTKDELMKLRDILNDIDFDKYNS